LLKRRKKMASVSGVQSYVAKAIAEEKKCLTEINMLVKALAGAREVPHITEKLTKLRNLSRDVGWMRRLLADLVHEQQMGGLE
jgi:hypothetical protein